MDVTRLDSVGEKTRRGSINTSEPTGGLPTGRGEAKLAGSATDHTGGHRRNRVVCTCGCVQHTDALGPHR